MLTQQGRGLKEKIIYYAMETKVLDRKGFNDLVKKANHDECFQEKAASSFSDLTVRQAYDLISRINGTMDQLTGTADQSTGTPDQLTGTPDQLNTYETVTSRGTQEKRRLRFIRKAKALVTAS